MLLWLLNLGFGGSPVAPPSWIGATMVTGTAVDANGVLGTTFLNDATPVPGGATMIEGIAHDANGLRYVAVWPGSGIVSRQGHGWAIRPDGAQVIIAAGVQAGYAGGVALTARGEAIVTTSAPDLILGGFGLKADGSLCMSNIS